MSSLAKAKYKKFEAVTIIVGINNNKYLIFIFLKEMSKSVLNLTTKNEIIKKAIWTNIWSKEHQKLSFKISPNGKQEIPI